MLLYGLGLMCHNSNIINNNHFNIMTMSNTFVTSLINLTFGTDLAYYIIMLVLNKVSAFISEHYKTCNCKFIKRRMYS